MPAPLIGITRDSDGRPGQPDPNFINYATSVEKAGGRPQPLYFRDDLAAIPALLDSLDGVIFSGGNDLDPALYAEPWHPSAVPVDPRRQRFELELVAQAEKRSLPIFGICLGAQLLNVHRGGSLVQFLPDHPRRNPLEHRKLDVEIRRHDVTLVPGSLVAHACGRLSLSVNTYHKQSIRQIGRALRATAYAPDGIVEAVEDPSLPLFLGVQWHPERLHTEHEHLALFQLLIQRAAR